MTENPNSNLEAVGLTKIYEAAGGTSGGIHPISFNLEPGTFFTLLGPSGCGKTTTLRCIAGLEQPDAGIIRLGQDDLFNAARGINTPLNRRNIGMVFQSYAIWPHMTVFENVAFPLRVAEGERSSGTDIRSRVMTALKTVDMAGFAERSSTQLSGGQQQRVALARAIVRRPRLLLLDEPLSNLDARLRDEMRTELKRLQKQLGVTTIYVTHDQSEALDMSDTIAVINKGRLIQYGSPREIYFKPRDTFVAGFLGSMNLLAGKINESTLAGSKAKVSLHSGETVVAHFPHGVAAGDVAVSVRPEAVVLRRATMPAGEGSNRFLGTIISSGFLGHANRYIVRGGETDFQVLASADELFEVGDAVAVDFTFDNAIGLDHAESSTRQHALLAA